MAISSTKISFWCLVLQGLVCFCVATSIFSDEDLIGFNLSADQAEILERLMTDYIDGFKNDIIEEISQPLLERTKRGIQY